MKKYIIIKHDNGSWQSIDAQFDSKSDAITYAKIASLGKTGHDFTIYEYVENHRED